jgi:hypothetical protein
MPQVGELVTKAQLKEIEAKCHFRGDTGGGPKRSDEDVADDDDDANQAQANDGGKLGKNVQKGRKGPADGDRYSPEKLGFLFQQDADDTARGGKRLKLESYKDIDAGSFPYTVAAHHLIPGNASLYSDAGELLSFLEDGGTVHSSGGTEFTIEGHIGYDVNGSHNGVWLPGNYAIKTELEEREINGKIYKARPGTTPVEDVSWEELRSDYESWRYAYVAGACKAAEGQFHDSHDKPYSESVNEYLQKMSAAMSTHLESKCRFCKKTKIPPPFRIKLRLFAISKKLRGYVLGAPPAWKAPWFTSEYWSVRFFKGGKVTKTFMTMYRQAEQTKPRARR